MPEALHSAHTLLHHSGTINWERRSEWESLNRASLWNEDELGSEAESLNRADLWTEDELGSEAYSLNRTDLWDIGYAAKLSMRYDSHGYPQQVIRHFAWCKALKGSILPIERYDTIHTRK